MSQINESNNKSGAVAQVIGFLSSIKKYIIIGIPVLLVILSGVVIVFAINDGNIKKSTARVLKIEETLLKNSVPEEGTTPAVDEQLVSELGQLVKQNTPWVSAKAAILLAGIHTQNKEWNKSVDILEMVDLSKASYLAPVVLFNAGSMAEEAGDQDKALSFYELCDKNYRNSFPEAPRVIFSMARIYEVKKLVDKAVEQYTLLVDSWSEDDYSSLAQSRLIALDASKGE